MATSIERTFTVEEVASALKLHGNTIYAYVHKGLIQAFRVGRMIRIPESELRRLYSTK